MTEEASKNRYTLEVTHADTYTTRQAQEFKIVTPGQLPSLPQRHQLTQAHPPPPRGRRAPPGLRAAWAAVTVVWVCMGAYRE